MLNRPIKGTTDWTKWEIVLDVPSNATDIAFGVLLEGTGQVCFDDVHFEVAGPLTGNHGMTETKLPAKPLNLDFEQ